MTVGDFASIMSAMTDEIVPEKEYSTGEVGRIVGLSSKQVGRLVDAGLLTGRRKSAFPKSPRVVTGAAIIAYLNKSKKQKRPFPLDS